MNGSDDVYIIGSGMPGVDNEIRRSTLVNDKSYWNPHGLKKVFRGIRRAHFMLPLVLKTLWLPEREVLTNAKHIIVFDGIFQSDLLSVLKGMTQAEIVYYFFNPISSYDQLEKVAKVADRVVTFDHRDAEVYGITHAPAFCSALSSESRLIARHLGGKRFDLFFVGKSKGRVALIERLIKQFERLGLKVFIHVQGSREEAEAYPFVTTNAIPFLDFEVYMCSSKAALDLTASSQRGMTMRGYQALGAGIKVVTDNKSLISGVEGDEKANVISLDEFLAKPQAALDAFLNSPFSGDCENFRRKYGFDEWVQKLLARQ